MQDDTLNDMGEIDRLIHLAGYVAVDVTVMVLAMPVMFAGLLWQLLWEKYQ